MKNFIFLYNREIHYCLFLLQTWNFYFIHQEVYLDSSVCLENSGAPKLLDWVKVAVLINHQMRLSKSSWRWRAWRKWGLLYLDREQLDWFHPDGGHELEILVFPIGYGEGTIGNWPLISQATCTRGVQRRSKEPNLVSKDWNHLTD